MESIEILNENTMLNCSHYFPCVRQLLLSDDFENTRESLPSILNDLMPLKQLTDLIINNVQFSLKQFIQLLYSMPNIRTLHSSYGFSLDEDLRHDKIFEIVSKNNQISNLYIRDRYELEIVRSFIDLCPQMQYLVLDVYANQIEEILRFIVLSSQSSLPKLCLIHLKNIHRSTFNHMKSFLKTDKLLSQYDHKIIVNEIYICF